MGVHDGPEYAWQPVQAFAGLGHAKRLDPLNKFRYQPKALDQVGNLLSGGCPRALPHQAPVSMADELRKQCNRNHTFPVDRPF